MNLIDIVLLTVIAAAVALAVRRLVISRKTGTCSCGCEGCSGRTGDCTAPGKREGQAEK